MDVRGQSSQDLNAQAMACLKQGDLPNAKSLLQQAITQTPHHLSAWTNLAGVLRTLGDFNGALDAVDAALKIEPRSFFALFFKGTILEQMGLLKEAASAYSIAFIVAPPISQQDANTQKALAQAKVLVDRIAAQKAAFLRDQMRDLLPSSSSAEQTRADILIGNLTGQRRAYVQEPLVFNYPQLPAIEFWDRSEFAWLEAVEAATSDIVGELQAVLAQDAAGLSPYIHYPDGLPVDQWANLNHNPDWSAYHLIEGGELVADHAQFCPKTLAALAQVPAPALPGRSPVALFSILKPHTHIPPHTGASNTRLLCHLPLIVPDKCRYRVGGTWRNWVVGEAFVFDDTIEHEAFNDSDQMRAVLIFDIWNPRLSEQDRAIITQITKALDAFNGTSGRRSDWI